MPIFLVCTRFLMLEIHESSLDYKNITEYPPPPPLITLNYKPQLSGNYCKNSAGNSRLLPTRRVDPLVQLSIMCTTFYNVHNIAEQGI